MCLRLLWDRLSLPAFLSCLCSGITDAACGSAVVITTCCCPPEARASGLGQRSHGSRVPCPKADPNWFMQLGKKKKGKKKAQKGILQKIHIWRQRDEAGPRLEVSGREPRGASAAWLWAGARCEPPWGHRLNPPWLGGLAQHPPFFWPDPQPRLLVLIGVRAWWSPAWWEARSRRGARELLCGSCCAAAASVRPPIWALQSLPALGVAAGLLSLFRTNLK